MILVHVAAVASINSVVANNLAKPHKIRAREVFSFFKKLYFLLKKCFYIRFTYEFFGDFEHNPDKLIIKKHDIIK